MRLKVYLTLFYGAGAVFLLYALLTSPPPNWFALLVFALLANVAESFPVVLPNSALVSVSFAIHFAALLVLGPAYAALVGFLTAWNWFEFAVAKRNLHKIVFNAFNYAFSAGIAGYAYLALGGQLSAMNAAQFPAIMVPIVLSTFVSYGINTFSIAMAIHSERHTPLGDIFKQNFLWQIPNYLMLSVVGVIFAQVYYISNPAGIILIVVPLLIARQTFQVYMKLKDAYLDTVRSLVQALEAKDAYTRGHSERVAQYAELIARQMKFSEQMVEMVRYAALLHDVGKIGVSRKILNKPDRLSRYEYELVQEHPRIGARIIEEVDFLQEPLSAVLYHHEHIDGSGYAFGLKGEEIPELARILTVADSFDAMTSARPYRDGMSTEEACQELIRCSGSQFDSRTVEAFIEAMKGQSGPKDTAEEGESLVVETV
ncbi:MAG: HD-GYP domain-containing protein [Candidatus Aquicultorales bacterium]